MNCEGEFPKYRQRRIQESPIIATHFLPDRPEDRLIRRLKEIYPPDTAAVALARILPLLSKYAHLATLSSASGFTQQDVVLITYADQIRSGETPTLDVLREFLTQYRLPQKINTVHLLPFCPYSSDDGFSVIDFRRVLPDAGGWPQVQQLAEHVSLMFDLVLNHISRESEWFQKYRAQQPPFDVFFIEVDPREDLSQVTRPRSLPLLTPVATDLGQRHVWTTFSEDQIDLNYANPEVLAEMLDVFLFYVEQGARIVRLDAIAFLWKEIGTNCLHLPQTHHIVRLMRELVELLCPHVVILTETNVPHLENISYFGDGDEAHMVYQFSLPPLLLDAFVHQDTTYLTRWLASLEPPPKGASYFNFTASHDGIGVRPLEGLVPPERLSQLVEHVTRNGARIGTRRQTDGTDAPYELNITYLDALHGPDFARGSRAHSQCFLATQAVMLALQGVPGIYFNSLVGTPNDSAAVESSGIARRINRRKYDLAELVQSLGFPDSQQSQVFQGYQDLLEVRIAHPAFHPQASQTVLASQNTAIVAFLRESLAKDQRVLVVANVASRVQNFDIPRDTGFHHGRDLLTGQQFESTTLTLQPFQVIWLEFCKVSTSETE